MSASRAALYLTTAVGLATACPALAQDVTDTTTTLDGITVSASSQPVKLSETGASVTVLTADELQKSGSPTLAEQLALTPGVSFTRNGGLGATTSLRIRGLNGTYIGTRLDGIDITDAAGTTNSYDFGTALTGGLSRVEVLRGSQSALYGANAVAGVVDMTTWRPETEGTSGQVSVEAGSEKTLSSTASAGILGSRGELAFTAGRTVTSGISAVKDGSEDDGFRSSMASLYGRFDATETLSFGANGIWQRSKTDMDGSDPVTWLPADTNDRTEQTLRGGRVFTDFTIGAVSNELAFARTETDRSYIYPDGGYTSDFNSTRNVLDYTGHWAASEAVGLNWGAATSKETADGYGTAKTNSVNGELLLKPVDTLDLSLAARNDVHDMFGAKTTGRIAAAWHATPDWTLRASASTGFRAPSLYQLYSPYGDANLKAETSKTFEYGAERSFEGGSVQATVFRTTITNRIDWDYTATSCGSGYGCYNQVEGDTVAKGIELTGTYDLTRNWTLSGNYTYTDASTASGRAVLVPRHTANLGVDGLVTDRWHLGGSVEYNADIIDSTGPMPDYALFNASVAYDINDKTQAYVRIDNLFDRDYETVRYYSAPGRQLFAGLRARF
ncbi:TonB-dependent receptor plug domain-containing protein [Paenirhodobacter enshiensis]|uniref:TonB-dependent receptor plug domain-containing protein n=1 Tax=Paenirhodobacter enshiensis TaxID=1105367 RepID=UPI003FA2EFD3